MQKNSSLNVLMLFLSIVGAVLAFIFGEMLLSYMDFLPYWVQCGAYLLFVLSVTLIIVVLSEKIHTGNYLLKHQRDFGMTAGKAALIFLPIALALGMLTQWLYGLGFSGGGQTPKFQGTMMVCDISGSMEGNDPNMDMAEAIVDYIDTIPLREYLGIILFNDGTTQLREYSPLKDETERRELKRLVRDEVSYWGGTDIDAALHDAFTEMRGIENPNWPGLIMLFSDGESDIDYNRLRRDSEGDSSNPRNAIPVNTIFFSPWEYSGGHMERIAEETGGVYLYIGVGDDASTLREAFTLSRSELIINDRLHLIKYNTLDESRTPLKIILRALFLILWGVLSGIFIVVFLNNSLLIKHFLIPKIIVTVLFAIACTVIMHQIDTEFGSMIARALLSVSLCTLYLPTYRWS